MRRIGVRHDPASGGGLETCATKSIDPRKGFLFRSLNHLPPMPTHQYVPPPPPLPFAHSAPPLSIHPGPPRCESSSLSPHSRPSPALTHPQAFLTTFQEPKSSSTSPLHHPSSPFSTHVIPKPTLHIPNQSKTTSRNISLRPDLLHPHMLHPPPHSPSTHTA